MICTDLKDQMSAVKNAGLGVVLGKVSYSERNGDEPEQGNKWSNRRYEQPGTSDPVENIRIGATNVVIKYDLMDSAPGPGIASKLLSNPTNPVMA